MTTCISRDADMSVVGGGSVGRSFARSQLVLKKIASLPAEDDSNAAPC